MVTSGPTREAIDPVRYLSNHSSGRQGHAIARALAEAGAEVTLVSGPVQEPDPAGVTTVHVESAREMLAAVEAALPADIAVCAAAVADWRPAAAAGPQDQEAGRRAAARARAGREPGHPAQPVPARRDRPALVIGFAAETGDLEAQARAKLARKGCDWILANDVSPGSGVFGGASNRVLLLTARWAAARPGPSWTSWRVARRLVERIADQLGARHRRWLS